MSPILPIMSCRGLPFAHCTPPRLVALRAALIVVFCLLLAACDLFTSVETRIERAQAQISERDFQTASIELKNALQEDPENGQARRLLAEVSLHLGDALSAEADLRKALDYGVSPAGVAELSARIRLALGQHIELLTAIDAGELPLEDPAKILFRGRALQGLARYEEALGLFEQVLLTEGDIGDAVIGAAEAEAGLGRFDAAFSRLDALTALEPMNAPAWLARGTLSAARGQFDVAYDALAKARESGARQLTAQQRAVLLGSLAEVELSRGNIPAAEAAQLELGTLFPGAPLTRFLGARIALVRQDYANAATELQRIVAAAPTFMGARFLLGAVSLAQGRLQQADLHLSMVVQNSPENLQARKLLAQVRMRLDRPDEAVQVLVPALESGALDPQLNALLGAAQEQAGLDSQESAALERALSADPEDQDLHLGLAAAYLREGEARKALALLDAPPARAGGILREALVIAALAASEGPAAADAQLNRLVLERPSDIDVLNLAGGLLIQRAEIDRARGILTRALAISPEHPASLLSLARLEVAAGRLAIARGYLEKLSGIDTNNSMVVLGLADVALRQGDRAGAIRIMEGWRTIHPRVPGMLFQLARLYLMDNQLEAAQKVVSEAIVWSPDQAEGQNIAGSLFLELGRYEQAVASFRKAVEANESQPTYWLNLAQSQLALDQRSGAREATDRALGLRPEWIPAIGVAALLDLRDGNSGSALERVRSLRERRPRDPAALMLEGDVLLATQGYREAAAAFDAAYAIRPESNAAFKSYRARFLGRLGGLAEPLEQWLAQNPGDVAARAVLAEAYQLAGQQIRAMQQYQIVVRESPQNALALNNLAWLYYLQQDDRALETAKNAFDLASDSASIADTYGWILVQSGRHDEGFTLLDQAAKVAPDASEIRYHRAVALVRLGRREEARRELVFLLSKPEDFESRGDAQRLLTELEGA